MMHPTFALVVWSIFLSSGISAQKSSEGIVMDIDGNSYHTVLIGQAEWMVENLRVARLCDGTGLPCLKGDSLWLNSSTPAYCWYQNDSNCYAGFGALYNGYAAMSGKLCPTGWRLPTEEDWTILSMLADSLFGRPDSSWYRKGILGYDAGMNLRAKSGWKENRNGMDRLGFCALPGGERSGYNASFHLNGINGYWWSSEASGENDAWYRSIIYKLEGINRNVHPKKCGFSVRCTRDKN